MVSTALKTSTKLASAAAAAASNVLLALCSGSSPEAAQVVCMRFVFLCARMFRQCCYDRSPCISFSSFSLIVELNSFPALCCFETSFILNSPFQIFVRTFRSRQTPSFPSRCFQIEIAEVGAMRALVALAANCDGRAEAWRAIAACGRGRRGGAVLGTVAAEVVRSGLRCLATGWTESAEKETVSVEFAADNDGDEEVISLISALVGNVLFYSQAHASAADHIHVNATVQRWLRSTPLQSSRSSSSSLSLPPPLPPISLHLLFALQNLAIHHPTAVLLSSAILPSHFIPLITPSTFSRDTIKVASFASGDQI